MKSLPFVPRQTVVFLPRRMKVKTSPYCSCGQLSSFRVKAINGSHLLTTSEEKFIRINSIADGTADDRDQVEDDRRFLGVLEDKLLEYIKHDSENDKSQEARANCEG